MATSILEKNKQKCTFVQVEERSSAVIERYTCGAVDCATGGRGAIGHEP